MNWERYNILISWRPNYLRTILTIVGGALYSTSNVGFAIWPLVFIFAVPLWLVLEDDESNKVRNAFYYGLVFGLTAFIIGFHWLLNLSQDFIGGGTLITYGLWLSIGIWFSLGFSIYAICYVILRSKGIPQWLAGWAPFIIMEWLQPNLFPSYAGAALISKLELAQLANLGGPLLLSTFVLVINTQIYRIISTVINNRGEPQHSLILPSILSISLIASAWTYGLFVIPAASFSDSKETGKALKIGSVQTNLVKLSKEELSARSHQAHLKQSYELLSDEKIDLLIWPETAYVRGLRKPLPIDAQFVREELGVPLLFGGTSVWEHEGRKVTSNSVFLSNRTGVIDQVYDKNILIPFAEYIPYRHYFDNIDELIRDLFPFNQIFMPGKENQALEFGNMLIQTPICFEIVHPDFIRQSVKLNKPDMIVTLANDAWFGDSQEPWIHLSLARLRAIEHNLWLVRATNSGISAVIDPQGNITKQTKLHQKENLIETVYPSAHTTIYTRFGNWIAWVALVSLIFRAILKRELKMAAPLSNS